MYIFCIKARAKCMTKKFPPLQNLIQFSLDTLMMFTGVNPVATVSAGLDSVYSPRHKEGNF